MESDERVSPVDFQRSRCQSWNPTMELWSMPVRHRCRPVNEWVPYEDPNALDVAITGSFRGLKVINATADSKIACASSAI